MSNRRSGFIINRKFQFKYILLITSICSVFYVLASGIAYYLTTNSINTLIKSELNLAPELVATLIREQNIMLTGFILGFVFLIILIAIISSMLTHKIAGPIWVLQKHLKQIIDNNFSEDMRLRKNDEFQEIKIYINELKGKLREENNALANISNDPNFNSLNEKSKKVLNKYSN